MIIRYLFASPEGDIPLSPEDLSRPFKISPTQNHPFLILRDYFKAIETFFFKHKARVLSGRLQGRVNAPVRLDFPDECRIRSEKCGAVYHIARVEIFQNGRTMSFAVCTAITEKARGYLDREYDLINHLNEKFKLPYLPKVFSRGEVPLIHGTRKAFFSMVLAEWLEGYHEWHLSEQTKTGSRGISIWDLDEGYRFASQGETFEIYRQAAKILTLYYDTRRFRHIYPWHHAAGDFVVGIEHGDPHVKLTTVRGYGRTIPFREGEKINPWTAILYFFLDMTVKMRLDKLDGIGKIAWSGECAVNAVTEGFFDGLTSKGRDRIEHKVSTGELLSLLKSFSREELGRLWQPLLEFYREENGNDSSVIVHHIEEHTGALYQVIQRFHE
jgi:hypothetical protein